MTATDTDVPRYAVHGLALVPIPRGKKGPALLGWNERQKAILTPAAAARIAGNVGLAHAWCSPTPTCAIDIDSYVDAEAWLAAEGIDLAALLTADDAVQIRSGREGRAKLLYRLPHIMPTSRISRAGKTLLELRCADAAGLTVQDVLPPSIHPDTGKPYEWGGAGDWRAIPDIPPALWDLWKRIHTLQHTTSGSDYSSGRATIHLPPEGLSDIRSALLSIDADDRDLWVRIGHALATLADEAAAFDAWMQWSSTSDKFDYKDAARVWLSFQPSSTGPQAIFAEAQRRGWKNPRAREAIPMPEPPEWLADGPDWSYSAEPAAMPHPDIEDAEPSEPRFRLLTGADLSAMPDIDWLVDDILPALGVAVMYGPPGCGKSFLAFDAACAMAEGTEWFGYRVAKPVPVVYVALEGEAGYKLRARAWGERSGRPLPDSLRMVLQPFALTSPRDIHELSRDILQVLPAGGAVIVDTLNRASPGMDENSSQDMGVVIEACKALHRAISGLVVLVAHTGKDTSRGIRGHSSLTGAVDSAIMVSREGDSRTWTTTKVKDGEDGVTKGFALEVVQLGENARGKPMTSCVIAPDDARAIRRAHRLTPSQQLGLRTFDVAEAAFGTTDRLGNPMGVHLENWRGAYYSESTADNADAKRKSFERARKDLVAAGLLAVTNDVYRRQR